MSGPVGTRRRILAVLGVAGLGTLSIALFFYPGYLNGDSHWQWLQARGDVPYSDVHPVVMAWVWSWLDPIVPGPGLLFLLHLLLFWLGLAASVALYVRGLPAACGVTLFLGIFPPISAMLSQVHKDVGMVASLLIGFALIGAAARTARRWLLPLALVPLWYAIALRHNGAAAAAPLIVWGIALWAGPALPGTPPWKRTLGCLAGAAVVLLALLGSSVAATRAILSRGGEHLAADQLTLTFDLAGVSVRTGSNRIPSLGSGPPLSLEDVRGLYHPHTVFYAYWGKGPHKLKPNSRYDTLPSQTPVSASML